MEFGEPIQTEDEKKICSFVRSQVEQARSSASRIAHESVWMTNIAYVIGYDGVVFNTNTRSFQPVNRGAGYVKKNRLHVNKILPTINNRLAKLCKNPPKFDIPPESNTQEDKDAARLGLDVLDSLWDKLSMPEKRILLMMWVQECGHGYVQVGWDPMAGQIMEDPMTGEADFEGDVFAEVFPAFEGFPDPYAKTFEDVLRTSFTRARVRPLEYFKNMYPEKGGLVKEESVWLLSAQYENRIAGMNNRGPGSGNGESQKNCAIELVRWEAPTREHPKGRVIVTANGILLKDEELPDKLKGRIPVAKFDDIIVAGKYYPESIVTHLRPMQDYRNDIKRRRAEWTKKFINGKYKAARGSNIIQEGLTDGESEVVAYDPVPNAPNGPEAIQVPSLPQYAYVEEEKIDQDWNELSGISEVSKGNIPSASIPAIGMQLLVESDDTRVGVTTEQHEHAFARVATLMLCFAEFGYTMPRKLKLTGKATQYNVLTFQGEQLRGNTDVRVIRGSLLPGSKTVKQNTIMNLYDRGILGDPSDDKLKQSILAATEFGDIQDLYQDLILDNAQIKKGIDLLSQGQPVEVSRFDNNKLWLTELNRLRKSEKFEILAPEIQDVIVNHMMERIDQIADSMAPPAPPPPPPPGMNDLQAMSQGGAPNGNQPTASGPGPSQAG